jgi:hypothetical protein
MVPEFYDGIAPDVAVYAADMAEVAEERDQYAAEARDMRERLALATLTVTEQGSLIAALRSQLHAAGIMPTGSGWRIGVAA